MARSHPEKPHFESLEEERAHYETERLLERIDLDRKLQSRRNRVEQELKDYYGPDIHFHRREIKLLQSKLDQSGVKGWWYRTRHGADARQEIENHQRSMANAQWRMREQVQGLDNKDAIDRDRLLLLHREKEERYAIHYNMRSSFALIKEEMPQQSTNTNEKSLPIEPSQRRGAEQKPAAGLSR